jgi:hypothetical protein
MEVDVANSPTTAAPVAKPEAHDPTHQPRADEPKPDLKPVDPATQVKTIGDEQRERSTEIEKVGVAKWVEEHDQRDPADKPRAVEGVAPGNPEVRKK